MHRGQVIGFHALPGDDRGLRLKDVVMGLHWDPPNGALPGLPADLDALCVLFDAEGRIVEVIHPGQPRSVDGSVIHTGDSRNGASDWDDERIFVFLEALAETVSEVSFVVLSATGRSFDVIPGARCHVSDQASDIPWLRVDLTALCGRTIHVVAALCRDVAGWRFSSHSPVDERRLFPELATLIRSAK